MPSRPSGWSAATVGALVAVYTRLGDRVAIVDPDLSGTVAPVTEWLGRRADLLRLGRFAPPAAERRARLVLAHLPDPGIPTDAAFGQWMHRVVRSLTERGYLAVTIDPFGAYPAQRERTSDRGRARYRDHTTSVIVAARAAGLRYQQHLIALHTTSLDTAPLDTDTGGRSRSGLQDPPGSGGRRVPSHERQHTDIFIFATYVATIPVQPQAADQQEVRGD
ncbi:hypothetical protein [Cryptosporangium sp. NPDC048952]|uniref:hypothetical protein n=1 Tax=Cryptosporangium sp. NPDC048952 TaxID=3363961 RepID=UPI003723C196